MPSKTETAQNDSKTARTPLPAPMDAGAEQQLLPTQESAGNMLQRTAVLPNSVRPVDAKQLQRLIGNRAVGKLNAGSIRRRPDDRQQTADSASASFAAIINRTTQLGKAPNTSSAPPIQAKLTLGPVGDKYEQEADQVAKQVVGSLSSSNQLDPQRQEEEEELQMKPISSIQRQEEEELQMKPLASIQRQEEEELQMQPADSFAGGPISSDLESQIQGARGGGQPLADPVRGSMEQAFGANFSGVKVHTDSQSDTLNRSVQARAFTTGSDIFFRQGEYSPGSSAGQELLAHELTHTIQQGAAPVQRQPATEQTARGESKFPADTFDSYGTSYLGSSGVLKTSVDDVTRESSVQRHDDETLQRHSDAELEEQIETARLQEEEGIIQPKRIDRARPRMLVQRHLESGDRIQRHLLPKAEGRAAQVTSEMVNDFRNKVNENKPTVKQGISSWLESNVTNQQLKADKIAEVSKLDWTLNLQKLDFPAQVHASWGGEIKLFPRLTDHYLADSSVDIPKLKTTMTHEAFHSISARHTGLQTNDTPDFTGRDSFDEAFTDLFAMQAFYLSEEEATDYISGYWTGTGANRWTGDLAQIVEAATGLTREDMITAYLSNPTSALQEIQKELPIIKGIWDELKKSGSETSVDYTARGQANQTIREMVEQAKVSAQPSPPSQTSQAPSPPVADMEALDPDDVPKVQAGAQMAAPRDNSAKIAILKEEIPKYAAADKLPRKNRTQREEANKIEDVIFERLKGADIITERPQLRRLNDILKSLLPKSEAVIRYDVLHEAAKTLGFRREGKKDFGLNIVIPPPEATADTKLSELPNTSITPTLRASGLATMKDVFPDLQHGLSVADQLEVMGGGGYEAKTFTIGLTAQNAGSLQHYVHEIGHLKQHQQGYTEYDEGKSDDMPRKKQALLLDYHNIVVNENPGYHLQKGGDDPTIRVRYTDEPREEKMSEAAEKGKPLTITPLESFGIFKASSRQMRMLIDIAQVPLQYSPSQAAGLHIGHYILNNLMVEARKKGYDVKQE